MSSCRLNRAGRVATARTGRPILSWRPSGRRCVGRLFWRAGGGRLLGRPPRVFGRGQRLDRGPGRGGSGVITGTAAAARTGSCRGATSAGGGATCRSARPAAPHEERANQAAGQRRPGQQPQRARGWSARRAPSSGAGERGRWRPPGRPQLATISGEGGSEMTVLSEVLLAVGAVRHAPGGSWWAAAAAPPAAGTPRRAWRAPRAPGHDQAAGFGARDPGRRPFDEVGLVEQLEGVAGAAPAPGRGSGTHSPSMSSAAPRISRPSGEGTDSTSGRSAVRCTPLTTGARALRSRPRGSASRRPAAAGRPGPRWPAARRWLPAEGAYRVGRPSPAGPPSPVSTSWVRLRASAERLAPRVGVAGRAGRHETSSEGKMDVRRAFGAVAPTSHLAIRQTGSGTPGQHAQLRKVFEEAQPEVNPGDPQTAFRCATHPTIFSASNGLKVRLALTGSRGLPIFGAALRPSLFPDLPSGLPWPPATMSAVRKNRPAGRSRSTEPFSRRGQYRLAADAARRVALGHPWVFREALGGRADRRAHRKPRRAPGRQPGLRGARVRGPRPHHYRPGPEPGSRATRAPRRGGHRGLASRAR